MTATATKPAMGLFIVSYRITTDVPGAPDLLLNLTVNTPAESVAGVGHVTQAVNPPLDITSKVSGTFSFMTVMPNTSRILVKATGWPNIDWHGGGVGPVIPANLEIQLVLDEDWQSGTASFKYRADLAGPFTSINDAKVTKV